VGLGASGLVVTRDDPPGSGPLAGMDAGGRFLRQRGYDIPALVVACDLPFLDVAVLEMLAGWPGDRSVVPIVDGHPQLLCARWSSEDLRRAGALVGAGERAVRALFDQAAPEVLDEDRWPDGVSAAAFADVDGAADLERLGVSVNRPAR
jgi:molybdopterin-guanine dinucleotide biosynthesis protein A